MRIAVRTAVVMTVVRNSTRSSDTTGTEFGATVCSSRFEKFPIQSIH